MDTDNGFDPDDLPDEKPRRGRGYLASDVDRICRQWSRGEFTLPGDAHMTPWYIAKLIQEIDCIDLEERPSTGAVARVLKKWERTGYAVCRTTPFAFVCYTEKGEQLGLQSFMAQA